MLYTLTKSVAATATPEALASSRTPCSWVTVQAYSTNTGAVYVGGVDENKAIACKNSVDNGGLYVGHRLPPGDFCNLRELGGVTYLDLLRIYIAVDNAGDTVTVNYGRR